MRKMKDSGISFVGNIPDNWKVLKNKRCFELEKDIVGPKFGEYQLLSLTKRGVILKDINNTYGKTPESYETYQSVKRGQLIMCLFDLDISAVFSGITDYNGMISPAYKIYNCKNNIYNRYAGYWFDFCFDGRKYMSFSKSLRYVVNTDDFKDIEIIVPPLEQQYKIVQFLDKKITEIDNVIEKTKQTIEDYKLYKQSIITKAITKGLDETVEMKDSGIEWIGKIPKNYNIKKIKHLGNARNGLTYSPENICDESEGTLVLRSSNILDGKLTFSDNVYVNKEISNELMVNKDDILICSRNGSTKLIGKNAIIEKNMRASFGAFMMIFKPKKRINSKYIKYILDSNVFKYYLATFLTSTINQLTNDNFSNMKIVFCDNILEQEMIVSYLDKKCNEIDKLINNKENLISKLEQYKKSLIYEYVTGKKEVI